MIVADTGPIIAFSRIDRLDLLRQVVIKLVIPDAVYQELVGSGRQRPGAKEIEQSEWILRNTVTDRAAVIQLPSVLHAGEREAIVLAQELQAQLLIDERRGHAVAEARGLEAMGSLRILSEAKRQEHVDQVGPVIEAMLAAGYWMDEELLHSFFQEIGETDR